MTDKETEAQARKRRNDNAALKQIQEWESVPEVCVHGPASGPTDDPIARPPSSGLTLWSRAEMQDIRALADTIVTLCSVPNIKDFTRRARPLLDELNERFLLCEEAVKIPPGIRRWTMLRLPKNVEEMCFKTEARMEIGD